METIKITRDYHTHTTYSHGKGSILDNAKVAKERGLQMISISDHGFSHPAFGMSRRLLDKMKSECNEASSITGVDVKLGIESNILGIDGKCDVKEKDYEKLDCYLAGIHRFILYDSFGEWFKLLGANYFTRSFKKDPSNELIKRNTKVYINCIKNNPIDILTHPNYLIFADAEEVAKCCADYGTLFEISSKKEHLNFDEWQIVIATGVNFCISSDAHRPEKVGDTTLATKVIEENNIPLDRIVNISGNTFPKTRFQLFKEKL